MKTINVEELRQGGKLLGTAMEGTCRLYTYKGIEYVVLQDNSIITRAEDNISEAIFPY